MCSLKSPAGPRARSVRKRAAFFCTGSISTFMYSRSPGLCALRIPYSAGVGIEVFAQPFSSPRCGCLSLSCLRMAWSLVLRTPLSSPSCCMASLSRLSAAMSRMRSASALPPITCGRLSFVLASRSALASSLSACSWRRRARCPSVSHSNRREATSRLPALPPRLCWRSSASLWMRCHLRARSSSMSLSGS